MKKRTFFGLAICLASFAPATFASPITGVTATSTASPFHPVSQMLDGNGLSSYTSPTFVQGASFASESAQNGNSVAGPSEVMFTVTSAAAPEPSTVLLAVPFLILAKRRRRE